VRRTVFSSGLLILCGAANAAAFAQLGGPGGGGVQSLPTPVQIGQTQISADSYQGSVADSKLVPGVLPLSLDDAIERGLRHNLGVILSGQNQISARATQLSQLQSLLPTVSGNIKESEQETDLQAEGLRISGFPAIIGPYAYTDLRGSLNWTLLSVASLRNYLASKHNFQSAQLSVDDARDEVVLSVGNAYLLVIADKGRIEADQAQVATSKVSLDQAVANHQAGTSPLLDELRARVDYQTQQQNLIQAQATFDKDKIALARVIGLPLEQQFDLTDTEPYAALNAVDPAQAVAQAIANRKDLKAFAEQVAGAEGARKAASAERYPTVSFSGDYGDIGVNVLHSHGTGDATGTLDIPILEEGKIRGDELTAKTQLEQKQAQLSNLKGQIAADVRSAILDIEAAEKQVQVAQSNVQLANEELSEAQQRFAAGVTDNLSVSQAQQSVAQANDQYISSLYQHNVAKLTLARALGVAQTGYKAYVGGR
jgi:outer membrane protein TolC